MRFVVYNHKLVYNDSMLIQRSMIVLKEADDIVGWTDFHKYVRGGGSRSITSNAAVATQNVVKLLNYVFFDKYHINRLTEIEKDMVKNFLNDYGLCRLPDDKEDTHRTKGTVERCIATIMSFLEEMILDNKNCKMKINDLYVEEKQYSKKRRRYVTVKKPVFEVLYTRKAIERETRIYHMYLLSGKTDKSHPLFLKDCVCLGHKDAFPLVPFQLECSDLTQRVNDSIRSFSQ